MHGVLAARCRLGRVALERGARVTNARNARASSTWSARPRRPSDLPPASSVRWSGDVSNYPAKVRRDALPTLRAGWSFWVPASSVNFALVPTRHQVLYMSACSIVWNVILSLNLNK